MSRQSHVPPNPRVRRFTALYLEQMMLYFSRSDVFDELLRLVNLYREKGAKKPIKVCASDVVLFLSIHHGLARRHTKQGYYLFTRAKQKTMLPFFGRDKIYALEAFCEYFDFIKIVQQDIETCKTVNVYFFNFKEFNDIVERGDELLIQQDQSEKIDPPNFRTVEIDPDTEAGGDPPKIRKETLLELGTHLPKTRRQIDRDRMGVEDPKFYKNFGSINRAQKSAGADSVALVDVSQSDSMGSQHIPNEQDQAPNKDWKDPLDEFQDNQGAPALPNIDPSKDIEDNDGMVIRGHSNLGPPCSGRPASRTNLEPSGQADKIWGQTQPRQRRRIKQ